VYLRIIAMDDDDASAWFNLGHAHESSGDFAAAGAAPLPLPCSWRRLTFALAAAAYLKATQIEPESPKYFNNLGTSLSATGASPAAVAFVTRQTRPRRRFCWRRARVEALHQVGPTLRRRVRLPSTTHYSSSSRGGRYYNLGNMLLAQDKPDDAMQHLTSGAALHPARRLRPPPPPPFSRAVLALRIRPGHSPAKKKLQQARDAVEAKAAAMRAQIDAAIEKAQQQQVIDAEKEKASLTIKRGCKCTRKKPRFVTPCCSGAAAAAAQGAAALAQAAGGYWHSTCFALTWSSMFYAYLCMPPALRLTERRGGSGVCGRSLGRAIRDRMQRRLLQTSFQGGRV
jgi:tetratricopeptide (TPR) repeat protein